MGPVAVVADLVVHTLVGHTLVAPAAAVDLVGDTKVLEVYSDSWEFEAENSCPA